MLVPPSERENVYLHFRTLFASLPAELQAEVFAHHDPPILHPGYQQRVDLPPLAYSQVCRQWRNVVLSNPRLWSSFVISLDLDTDFRNNWAGKKGSLLLGSIDRWLNRSACAPLDIHLVCHSEGPLLPQVIRSLAKESHRWHTMAFHMPSVAILLLADALGDGHSISVAHATDFRSTQSSSFGLIPFSSSQLRPVFPRQLRTLSLHADISLPSFDDIVQLLSRQCPHIEHLDFQVLDSFSIPLYSEPFSSPSLRTLGIDLFPIAHPPDPPAYQHLATFLALLSAPSLEKLRITSRYHLGPFPPLQFAIFQDGLRAFGGSLVNLTLRMLPMSDSQLIQCLECVPQLVSLELDSGTSHIEISDSFFLDLTLRSERGLCPRLNEFTVRGRKSFSLVSLKEFVDSRCREGGAFRVLELLPKDKVTRELPLQARQIFEDWTSLGLTIHP